MNQSGHLKVQKSSDMHFGADILISRVFLDEFNIERIHEYMESGVLRSVLLDSGAFTYHRKNIDMPVENYIEFLKGLTVPIWRYFTLDVIGNPVTTMVNLRKMYDAGLTPIPIWQRGMTRDEIDEMYEMSDLVAIGGVVGRPHLLQWAIEKLWPKNRKLHILGLGAAYKIEKYAPYSIDNSNFSEYRWGRIKMYMGRNRWLPALKYGDKPTLEQRWFIEGCGFDPDLLRTRSVWYNYRHVGSGQPAHVPVPGSISAASWQWYALDLRERGLTRVFMAFVTNHDFQGVPVVVKKAKAFFTGEVYEG